MDDPELLIGENIVLYSIDQVDALVAQVVTNFANLNDTT
jgi:hypothetical protein